MFWRVHAVGYRQMCGNNTAEGLVFFQSGHHILMAEQAPVLIVTPGYRALPAHGVVGLDLAFQYIAGTGVPVRFADVVFHGRLPETTVAEVTVAAVAGDFLFISQLAAVR